MLILISVVSIVVGFFLFFKPGLAIEIQRRFYEKINWRIEPISMPKEVRNTKIMGMLLVSVALGVIIYYCLKLTALERFLGSIPASIFIPIPKISC